MRRTPRSSTSASRPRLRPPCPPWRPSPSASSASGTRSAARRYGCLSTMMVRQRRTMGASAREGRARPDKAVRRRLPALPVELSPVGPLTETLTLQTSHHPRPSRCSSRASTCRTCCRITGDLQPPSRHVRPSARPSTLTSPPHHGRHPRRYQSLELETMQAQAQGQTPMVQSWSDGRREGRRQAGRAARRRREWRRQIRRRHRAARHRAAAAAGEADGSRGGWGGDEGESRRAGRASRRTRNLELEAFEARLG